jgi:deoxyribodipyrimidine photolyase
MDETVRELVETGYIHNHARMWFASFVVHFRKLGWKAGRSSFTGICWMEIRRAMRCRGSG